MPASATYGPVQVFLGAQNGKFPDGNQVLVQGSDTCLAFDTPLVARQLLQRLRQVDGIVLGHVHEDHTVALGDLLHVPVQVHAQDLAALQSWQGLEQHYGYEAQVIERLRPLFSQTFGFTPRPDATAYQDGQLWELGGGVRVRVHHLPGHTRGHCALVEESSGVAFIGDIDLSSFGPYYGDASSDLAQFIDTLQRVRDIEARVWVTSHHKGVITDRTQFLETLQRFGAQIEVRHQKLLDTLAQGPRSMAQLVAEGLLYPADLQRQLPHIGCIEARAIGQHLHLLQAQGLVDCTPASQLWYKC